MTDILFIKQNPELIKEQMQNRNMDSSIVDKLISIEKTRLEKKKEIEENNRQKNINSDKLKNTQDKKSPEAQNIIEEGKKIKDSLKELEASFESVEKEYSELMVKMPNIYSEETPIGKSEDENVTIKTVGEPTKFDFTPLDHYDLGVTLGLIDNERAAKVSGARFTYLKGDLALMEFALMQFAFKTLTNEETIGEIIKGANLNLKPKAFTPIIPPVFIRPDVMEKMGRLEPRDDRYHTELDDLYLIGSAEHTLGSMYMDETLSEKDLPLRFAGYSVAFRRESGTYGKDTKGIIRMHQFNKLEMETFSTSESAAEEQKLMVAIEEYLMQALQVPYRVISICTGDLGTPDARQIDIECWMPGQNKYRETHTSDLMTDFQSRRLNIKTKRLNGELEYTHMNDATAIASNRTLIAIMENYQQKDGSIKIPEVLLPFMHRNSDDIYIRSKI